jgi:hypothetical protein
MKPTETQATRLRYADILRQKMKTTDNPFGRPLMIRELARHIGYSYEHLRRAVNGDPVASRDFNNALCSALALDADKMWEVTRYEKLTRKFKSTPLSISMPPDVRFNDLWSRLTDEQKLKLFRIAEVYAMENDAETFLAKRQVDADATADSPPQETAHPILVHHRRRSSDHHHYQKIHAHG